MLTGLHRTGGACRRLSPRALLAAVRQHLFHGFSERGDQSLAFVVAIAFPPLAQGHGECVPKEATSASGCKQIFSPLTIRSAFPL